jgi:hypothetical protein
VARQHTAWVILMNGEEALYWYAGGFSPNLHDAVRLYRRKDARAIIEALKLDAYPVEETFG